MEKENAAFVESLWRKHNGKVCGIADKCCHNGASLSCGKIVRRSSNTDGCAGSLRMKHDIKKF